MLLIPAGKRFDSLSLLLGFISGRQLGGHKHEEIGKTVGLGKASSVSSAYLLMKERVAKEKPLQQRVRKIEEALTNSKKRT